MAKASKRKRLPPIPATVQGPAGDVTVTLTSDLKRDGDECWGLWDDGARTIFLDRSAPLAHRWRVLFHELTHVALHDAGLDNGMEERLVEAVCDAVASARMRERFG